MNSLRLTLLVTGLTLALSACVQTQPPPPISHDGLHLQPNTKFAVVYTKPGADFSEYNALAIETCNVAFRKNWLRDQNSGSINFSNRVTKKDVERIQQGLSELCGKVFSEVMSNDQQLPLLQTADPSKNLLILRPAIINLDVNAPDNMSPGRTRTYTTSAGEMTLYLELVDGATNAVVARVIDRQKDYDDSYLEWTNSVTNKADANRVLSKWAAQLKLGLDQIMQAPATAATPSAN